MPKSRPIVNSRFAGRTYYFSGEPTEEEREMCSCALAELEAEFSPYISKVKDECVFSTEKIEQLDPLSGWGYVKR
jgi:hypothetical protein